MADILSYLITTYDPRFQPSSYKTEPERIEFIKTIALYIGTKTEIKLNTRNLYKSDYGCVRELLKLSKMLVDARNVTTEMISSPHLDLGSKIQKLKATRMLASQITEKGAELYDLLEKEMEGRVHRLAVISKPFELNVIEQSIDQQTQLLKEKLQKTNQNLEDVIADESNLSNKIEKKRVEYERAEKRLKALQSVRPAYMDEFEKLEVELVSLYQEYIERFRNLAFLEQQLDELNRQEQDLLEETESTLKRMQNKLREEELKLLRGEEEMRNSRPNRPAAAGSRARMSRTEDSSDDFEGVSVDSEDSMDSGEEIKSDQDEEVENNDSDESSFELQEEDDQEMDDNDF